MFLLGKYCRTERAAGNIRHKFARTSRQQKHHRRKGVVLQALSSNGGQAGIFGDLDPDDTNELTTALNNAIAAEDYSLASKLRDRLRQLSGSDAAPPADWHSLGIPAWLADRAEQIGYRFPTEVQRRAAKVIGRGADAIIQSATGSGKTLAFVIPLLAALKYPPDAYPEDFQGPQLVIVVPTRELGVQTVMLIYQLFGGSVNAGIPGDPTNMFAYTGPRGVRVKGVLDKEEVVRAKNNGWLFASHVVVGTPQCLAELATPPNAFPLTACLRALAVDEVDAYPKDERESLDFVLAQACKQREQLPKPQVVLVGATLPSEDILDRYQQQGWMTDAVTLRVGRLGQVPAGLQHRYMLVDDARKLIVMCRQLRLDLAEQGEDAAPARVMVFVESEEAARAAAMPLRSGLWGDHKVSVLLPHGEEPIQALHAFRDNKATFLLATPSAARGLDLPAVSHVYNLDPPEDSVQYLHRAGRAGRIGSPVKGIVTTLVTKEQVPRLVDIAKELNLKFTEQPQPPADTLTDVEEGNIETAKRNLDDLYNLL
ncbi:g7080 [Coccomyxa elongata]